MEEIGQIFWKIKRGHIGKTCVCCLAFVLSKLEFPLNILKISCEYFSKYVNGGLIRLLQECHILVDLINQKIFLLQPLLLKFLLKCLFKESILSFIFPWESVILDDWASHTALKVKQRFSCMGAAIRPYLRGWWCKPNLCPIFSLVLLTYRKSAWPVCNQIF